MPRWTADEDRLKERNRNQSCHPGKNVDIVDFTVFQKKRKGMHKIYWEKVINISHSSVH